jgi:hypothetical protein
VIFWEKFNQVKFLHMAGEVVEAKRIYSALKEDANLLNSMKGRSELLSKLGVTYGLESQYNPQLLPCDVDHFVKHHKKGVSLVTCCMNRNENMVKALPSWIANHGIDEILIVDWSSKEPVRQYLDERNFTDERIKVVRVDDQPKWILSYAFNLGFRLASYDTILKTDADIIVKEDFFEKNKLSGNEFIAGDWRIAEAGQEHINGFFYLSRQNLMKVKGFNEYITTYGWDDDDIYNRFRDAGLTRKAVDTSSIYHIPHDDSLRTENQNDESITALQELSVKPIFKIRTNYFIASVMPVWNADRVFLPFKVIEADKGAIRVKKHGDSIHYVPKSIREDAEHYAALELLSWKLGLKAFDLNKQQVHRLLSLKSFEKLHRGDLYTELYSTSVSIIKPSKIVVKNSPADADYANFEKFAESLGVNVVFYQESPVNNIQNHKHLIWIPSWENLGNLNEIHPNQINDGGLVKNKLVGEMTFEKLKQVIGTKNYIVNTSPDKFYIDAQHGLGNRLRAIGSAAAIAKATGKELVIIWEPDHHCECRFSDLFDYEGEVIEHSFAKQAQEEGLLFNYMEVEEGSEKDKPIEVHDAKYTYARAAYTLVHEASHWEAENAFIKQLKPSKQVLELIEPFNVAGYIAAHIRMEAGKGLDNNTYDSVENWTQEGHDQLHYWREKSHYSAFIKRIDQLIEDEKDLKLFVATDLQETYDIFQHYYGDRLVYLKRNVFDRSKEQIIYAMADVLLLSKCKKLLGSTWSSFSEAAMRLSDTYSEIEMSGRDF